MIKRYFKTKFTITEENYNTQDKRNRFRLFLIALLAFSFVLIYFGLAIMITLCASYISSNFVMHFNNKTIAYLIISFVVFPVGVVLFGISVASLKKLKKLSRIY